MIIGLSSQLLLFIKNEYVGVINLTTLVSVFFVLSSTSMSQPKQCIESFFIILIFVFKQKNVSLYKMYIKYWVIFNFSFEIGYISKNSFFALFLLQGYTLRMSKALNINHVSKNANHHKNYLHSKLF